MKAICLVVIAFFGTCFGEIISINDSARIAEQLGLANKETLVLFDVDNVLLLASDPILQSVNRKYLNNINRKIEEELGKEAAKEYFSIVLQNRSCHPVDPRIGAIIRKIQTKRVKVVALTNCFTGEYGVIPSIEEWRYNELLMHGYHFDYSWQNLESIYFNDLQRTNKCLNDTLSPSSFYKGIVFASGVSKGEALKAFLEYSNFKPKKIIFIDDKKKHLESVQALADSQNIPFTGIVYTAVKDFYNLPLDEEKADLQYEILLREKKWTSENSLD